MISLGNRLGGSPLMVQTNKRGEFLNRCQFNKKTYDEFFIQELIKSNPEILPVSEIESSFFPLIPIGREVPTNVGPIDNLFISPDGYLTIVETKLWRNPEARREVVGQIIDYSKEVCKWSYEELDQRVKEFNKYENKNDIGLYETIKSSSSDVIDEHTLIDNIIKNLKRGRFLLLIVGDGIRESVESMVNYLQQTPQIQFTLALIELQVHEIPDDERILVLPQIVTRTREITRGIIKVDGANADFVHIDVELNNTDLDPSKRVTLSEQDFFDRLRQNDNPEYYSLTQLLIQCMKDIGCSIEFKSASCMVKLVLSDYCSQKFTLFGINVNGQIFGGWLIDQLSRANLDSKMGDNYLTKVSDLFKVKYLKDRMGWDTVYIDVIKNNMDCFIAIIRDLINEVKAECEQK